MKKLRQFKCDDCGVVERLVIDSVIATKCNCGKKIKRIMSAPRYFGNTVGRSPSA